MGTGSFPGVKRPERGVDHPPKSSAEVKERIELYLCSPLWAFVAYSRVNVYRILSNFIRHFIHFMKTQKDRFLLLRYYPIGELSHSSMEG
jgi:hypothetical protein